MQYRICSCLNAPLCLVGFLWENSKIGKRFVWGKMTHTLHIESSYTCGDLSKVSSLILPKNSKHWIFDNLFFYLNLLLYLMLLFWYITLEIRKNSDLFLSIICKKTQSFCFRLSKFYQLKYNKLKLSNTTRFNHLYSAKVHSFSKHCVAQSSVDTICWYFQMSFNITSADISSKYHQIIFLKIVQNTVL